MEPINKEEIQKSSLRALLFAAVPMLLFGLMVALYFAGQGHGCKETEKGKAAIAQVELMTEVRDTFEIMMDKWEDDFSVLKDKYNPEEPILLSELENHERTIEKILVTGLDRVQKDAPPNVAYTMIVDFQNKLKRKQNNRRRFLKHFDEVKEELIDDDEEDYETMYGMCRRDYTASEASLQLERGKTYQQTKKIADLQSDINALLRKGSKTDIRHVCIQKYDESYAYMSDAFERFIKIVKEDKKSNKRLKTQIEHAETEYEDAERRVKFID